MNIIKRVIRKFGVDIVRYSVPNTAPSTIPAKSIPAPLKNKVISSELASEALSSVGRKLNVPPFTYYQRPVHSSVKMEEAENKWWNTHGELIEKVWVLSDDINTAYRSSYVSKAAAFFAKDGTKARVLDLGCGSGWFGRMIASEQIEYVGMDFSSTQIAIANQQKAKAENRNHLNYYCATDLENIPELEKTTGVIIHAFLHHLYWDDLKNLFDKLKSVLPKGCKFFIVEPVYPEQKSFSEKEIQKRKELLELVHSLRKYMAGVKKELVSSNRFDLKTEKELNDVIAESAENGFFLSPKEVPFRMNEFREFLGNYMTIENFFFCGVTNLEVAQFIDRVTDSSERKKLIEKLLPASESLDKLLLADGYYEMIPSDYLFTSFEGTLKK